MASLAKKTKARRKRRDEKKLKRRQKKVVRALRRQGETEVTV